MSKISSVMLTLVLMLTSWTFSEEVQSNSLKELRARADEILKLSNVSARKDIGVVFTFVDRLLEEHQHEDAEKYIAQGLKHFPWNLKYQMVHAELLTKSGKQEEAKQKATLVFQYAETEELLNRAGTLLNREPIPRFEKMNKLPGTKPCVVLVPFQDCNKHLIMRIKDELVVKLEIPIFIQAIDTQYPSFSRDRRGAIINRMRKRFIKDIDDIQISNAMKNLNLTKKNLDEEDNVLKLTKRLLRSSDAEAIAKFDAYLEDSRGRSPQWNADQLQAALFRAVKPYRRKNVAYLGITSVDIYAKDYNFLFGWANRLGGIMSYRRFTADFNNDIPNRDRLIKRTLMQCLSSVGHIYGVKRCTNPTCARAYPNSLSEHDAKKGTLCSECKNGFKTRFEQVVGN